MFVDLTEDARDRIAAILFEEFTAALMKAMADSVDPEVLQKSSQWAYGHMSEVDTTALSQARKTLASVASVSRACRETFRRYYITAVFRNVVHEAEVRVSEADGVLSGINFKRQDLSVSQCASEITNLLTIVTEPSKIRFTGGLRKLLAIPLYHDGSRIDAGVAGTSPGLLSKSQAKAIFGINDRDFDSLPLCGKQRWSIGYSQSGVTFPKHVRDCAAAALARCGSFEALVRSCSLFKKSDKLQRLELILTELEKLHPSTQKHKVFRDLQRNRQRLTDKKQFRVNRYFYSHTPELRAVLITLQTYLSGKAEREAQKAAKEEEKKRKRDVREAKKAAKPPKKAKSAYVLFSADPTVLLQLKQANPDAAGPELTKLKRTRWESDTDMQKPFHVKAAADKARFKSETEARAKVEAAVVAQAAAPEGDVADPMSTEEAAAGQSAGPDAEDDSGDTQDDIDPLRQVVVPLRALMLADTQQGRINLLRSACRKAKTQKTVAVRFALSELCQGISKPGIIENINRFIYQGEQHDACLSLLAAAAARETELIESLRSQPATKQLVDLLPFVTEAVDLLLVDRARVTRKLTEAVISALNVQQHTMMSITSTWHDSVQKCFEKHRAQKLTRAYETFLAPKQIQTQAKKREESPYKVVQHDGFKVLDLPHFLHNHMLGECVRGSCPDRALELLRLIDSSSSIKLVRSKLYDSWSFDAMFKNASSENAIAKDLISFASYLSSWHGNLSKDSTSMLDIFTYIRTAAGFAADDAARLEPLLQREQALTQELHRRADKHTGVTHFAEALFAYARLSSVAREFVLHNKGSSDKVAAALEQMAMDEIAAVKLWGSDCHDWWEESLSNRSEAREAGRCYSRSQNSAQDFVSMFADVGSVKGLLYDYSSPDIRCFSTLYQTVVWHLMSDRRMSDRKMDEWIQASMEHALSIVNAEEVVTSAMAVQASAIHQSMATQLLAASMDVRLQRRKATTASRRLFSAGTMLRRFSRLQRPKLC